MKRKRPIVGVQRRYSWRLYPTPAQDAALRKQAAMVVDLWNALLEICETRYGRAVQRHGRAVSFHCAACAALNEPRGKIIKLCIIHALPSEFDIGYWISDKPGMLRRECPEWRALSTWTPRRVVTSFRKAFDNFFHKVATGETNGYPRYKSKRRHLSIPHRCVSGCRMGKSPRHERSWTLELRGVPGSIWTRGCVPAHVNEWTDVDIIYRDGHWEASCALAVEPRRLRGRWPIVVAFDLIDGLATVNGAAVTPLGLLRARNIEETVDKLKIARDRQWPRCRQRADKEQQQFVAANAEISRLAALAARVRRNALHVWTSRIVEQASSLTIIAPAIKESTRSPRGDKRKWGASVDTVSSMNRTILAFAPALAMQMLEYKAKETGIQCQRSTSETSDLAIGEKLVAVGKQLRRTKRALRRM